MTTEMMKQEDKQEAALTAERVHGGTTFTPHVDILETEDELLLRADLPGVEPGDLDIRYENKELAIEGRVAPRNGHGKYLYSEYGLGDFYRTFNIGETIDPEKISAEMKNGVLTLHLPKTEAVKPKRIEVKAG